jgi:nucleoside-diphosphate-sugar epimerase
MTILVTGASGGFGRILSAWLREHSAEPVVLARRASLQDDDCIACDVTDGAMVRALVRRVRPRLVYHLAGTFAMDYETEFAVNALSARHLLDALLEEHLDTRIVLAGSAAEYGVVVPEENPVSEDRVLRPVSVYGLTKAFQTQIAGMYAHQRTADVVVARMFNLLAPGLSEHIFVGRVERLIAKYHRGEVEAIKVGNLDHQRDYVTAEDAVAQFALIASRGERGRVHHVASGQPIVMRDLLRQMLGAAGVPVTAVREDATNGGHVGYDVPIIYADMRRTRALASESRMQ